MTRRSDGRARHAMLAAIAMTLVMAGVSVAQSDEAKQELDRLLPNQVASTPMHRVPIELEEDIASAVLASGDGGALLTLYGIEPGQVRMAVSTDFDFQGFMDAVVAGTLAESEADAALEDVRGGLLFVLAMIVGDDVDTDSMLDAIADLSPDSRPESTTIAGRRVVYGNSLDGNSEAWFAFTAIDGVLYVMTECHD